MADTDDQRRFADQFKQHSHAEAIRAQRSQQEEAAQNRANGEPPWFASRVEQIIGRSLHFAINQPHGISGGGGSYAINIKDTGGAGGAQEFPKPPNQPFQILYIGDVAGSPRIGVNYYSYLYKTLGVADNAAITGLLSASPVPADANGFAVPAIGQKIWLKIEVDNTQTFVAATIEHGANWTGYDDPVKINVVDPANPYQQYFYELIASVVAGGDARPGLTFTISAQVRKVVQCLNRNLRLEGRVINGTTGVLTVTSHVLPT